MDLPADISLAGADGAGRACSRMRLYVLLQLGGWGLFLGLETWATLAFPDRESPWPRATELAVGVLYFCTGVLLTHFLRPLMGRWRWKELGWRALLPRMAAAALLGAAAWQVFQNAWLHAVLGLPWNTKYPLAMVLTLQVCDCAILLFAWLSLYFFYHLFDRLNRSEIARLQLMTSVKEAELRALKSQVNPHFIFNSLNSLRALIDEDPVRARRAVTELANLLRYSLQSGQQETVAFEDELNVVNDYLALEQVRHEERLRLRLDIEPGALRLPVPPMLLQTLVENAVKFGVSQRTEGGEIAITARNEGGALRIQVSNPGRIGAERSPSTGVGLRNAAERLRLIFGEGATLRLRADEPARVVAEAVIPLGAAARP